MFVPDKAAAMREARRVLAPGGLFAFNVWDGIEANPHAKAVSEAIASLLPGDPITAFTKVPVRLQRRGDDPGDAGREPLRRRSGSSGPGSRSRAPPPRRLPSPRCGGTPRALFLQERGVPIDAVVDAVAAALVRVGGDNPYRSPGRALVVMARVA